MLDRMKKGLLVTLAYYLISVGITAFIHFTETPHPHSPVTLSFFVGMAFMFVGLVWLSASAFLFLLKREKKDFLKGSAAVHIAMFLILALVYVSVSQSL